MLQFLEQDPDDSFSRYAVALEFSSRGERERAIEYLTELRRRDPAYLATYYQLGGAYAALERYDEAEEAYRAGIDVGRRAGDLHTVGELGQALDELETMR